MNKKSILAVGSHPLVADACRQYAAQGCEVTVRGLADELSLDNYDELFVATASDDATADGQKLIAWLSAHAPQYRLEHHEGHPMRCHLLLHDAATLRLLEETGFSAAITETLDVYPFTMERVWSRQVVERLDRAPVTIQSDHTVHLVILGWSNMAEQVAHAAALVAHYPNYTRNQQLRTRITLIDPAADERCQPFIQHYRYLFENSFYREIHVDEQPAVVRFHAPQYQDRDVFTDIEWEFVKSSMTDALLHEKLALWASPASSQHLTLVFAHESAQQNLELALRMPSAVYEGGTPLWVYMQDDALLRAIPQEQRLATVKAFGMSRCGYDVTMPWVEQAKTVNEVYRQCYADTDADGDLRLRYAVEINDREREQAWQRLPMVKRMSSIYNALTIAPKMRSVGLKEEDWAQFYDIPQSDIELLAQVEHNRWSVAVLLLGWRPCTDEERAAVERDVAMKEELKRRGIHYDLCSYRELSADATGKNVVVYDLCLAASMPLIAQSVAKRKGGDQ